MAAEKNQDKAAKSKGDGKAKTDGKAKADGKAKGEGQAKAAPAEGKADKTKAAGEKSHGSMSAGNAASTRLNVLYREKVVPDLKKQFSSPPTCRCRA